MFFKAEAENCRQQALAYLGRPEGPFLLRVARAFDELADTGADPQPAEFARPKQRASASQK